MMQVMDAVSDSNEVTMPELKIYIVIQDPKTRQDVNITGSLDVLRAFLSGVGTLEIQDKLTSPIKDSESVLTPTPQPVESVTAN